MTRQHAQCQWAVGQHLNAETTANIKNASGLKWSWSQQGELDLHADQPNTSACQMIVQKPQALGTDVGDTELADLTLFHKISETVEKRTLLPGGITGCAPVQLDPIELATQPLPTGVKRFEQSATAEPPGEGSQLRGNNKVGA